jgi:hypothetical protein
MEYHTPCICLSLRTTWTRGFLAHSVGPATSFDMPRHAPNSVVRSCVIRPICL